MSIPLWCNTCYDIIGEYEGMSFDVETHIDVDCPGKGKHPKPIRTKRKRFFGLVIDITQEYPETWSQSSWSVYSGPPNKFLLWFAIFGSRSSTGGLIVNGEWAWRDWFNCYGDGWEKLYDDQ